MFLFLFSFSTSLIVQCWMHPWIIPNRNSEPATSSNARLSKSPCSRLCWTMSQWRTIRKKKIHNGIGNNRNNWAPMQILLEFSSPPPSPLEKRGPNGNTTGCGWTLNPMPFSFKIYNWASDDIRFTQRCGNRFEASIVFYCRFQYHHQFVANNAQFFSLSISFSFSSLFSTTLSFFYFFGFFSFLSLSLSIR